MHNQQNKQRKTLNVGCDDGCQLDSREVQLLEQQIEAVNIKIKVLANRTVDCILNQQPGQEFLPEMMMNFLEMALMMKKSVIKSIVVSRWCVSEVRVFIEEALNFIESVFLDQYLFSEYGFFTRLRMKAQIRKRVSNMKKRIKSAVRSISTTFEMSQEMVESMSAMSFRITNMIDLSQRRRMKKNVAFRKKNLGTCTQGDGGAAQQLIISILEERGVNPVSYVKIDDEKDEKLKLAGNIGDIGDIL